MSFIGESFGLTGMVSEMGRRLPLDGREESGKGPPAASGMENLSPLPGREWSCPSWMAFIGFNGALLSERGDCLLATSYSGQRIGKELAGSIDMT